MKSEKRLKKNMKKSKVIFSLLIVIAIISCFCTTVCAHSGACVHPGLICSECGKELVQCDQKFVDCDNYYCPTGETCPELKAHMQEHLFYSITITLLVLPIMVFGLVISIREIIKNGFKFYPLLVLAGDACFIYVYVKEIVPTLIEAIKYFS